MRFDAFQLRYIPGTSTPAGRIVIDQLRVSRAVIVSAPGPGTAAPARFALEHNYPNPFNPSTVIGYSLPVGARVTIRIYDLLGREVAAILDAFMPAGAHTVTWNPSECASGAYFARMSAFDAGGAMVFAGTTRLTLIR